MIEFERLEDCPICGSSDIKNHIVCKDHLKSNESFALVKCVKCSFVFTNPRPTKETIGFYYDSDKYYSHHNSFSIIGMVYSFIKKINLSNKVKLINKIADNKKGKLLDYGCGQGDFLNSVKENGWNITGVEIDNDARKNSIEKVGDVIKANIDYIKNETFQVITLWHVLEHIHDLDFTFKKIKSLLDKEGKLIIAVPNYMSYDGEFFKEEWAAYDVPRHLYHFDRDTLKLFAAKHKMKVKEEHPLLFDAYYISLLSDTKIHGIKRFLNAYKIGKKSNEEAKKTGDYSSVIYVLTK
jgi:2-polyprenyl-3-methyl-5-hydroxy-6-metoxy-1,4-benzoquinol methylase